MLRTIIISEGTQPFCIDLTHPTLYIKTVLYRQMNLFYDFHRFCHFELEQISIVDPAITFFNDFQRFYHFELQKISKGAAEGQGTGPGPPCGPKHRAFSTSKNPLRQSLIGQ